MTDCLQKPARWPFLLWKRSGAVILGRVIVFLFILYQSSSTKCKIRCTYDYTKLCILQGIKPPLLTLSADAVDVNASLASLRNPYRPDHRSENCASIVTAFEPSSKLSFRRFCASAKHQLSLRPGIPHKTLSWSERRRTCTRESIS